MSPRRSRRSLDSLETRRAASRRRRHKRCTRPLTALEVLIDMGYPRERALQALRDAVGDLEKAVESFL